MFSRRRIIVFEFINLFPVNLSYRITYNFIFEQKQFVPRYVVHSKSKIRSNPSPVLIPIHVCTRRETMHVCSSSYVHKIRSCVRLMVDERAARGRWWGRQVRGGQNRYQNCETRAHARGIPSLSAWRVRARRKKESREAMRAREKKMEFRSE